MENGFNFELYETVFENCFIDVSRYDNGNLSLSLFGMNPETNDVAHLIDITLDQNRKILKENEIVVNCKYNKTLIPQLVDLGILKEQVGICIVDDCFYPIYTIDFTQIAQEQYCMQVLAA